jgi:hypothetical protein
MGNDPRFDPVAEILMLLPVHTDGEEGKSEREDIGLGVKIIFKPEVVNEEVSKQLGNNPPAFAITETVSPFCGM